MNYSEVLQSAWKIVWKHKILWLFGLLASCGQGRGGGGSGGNSNFSNSAGRQNNNFNFNIPGLEGLGRQIEQITQSPEFWLYVAGIVLALICLGFILSLLFAAIGTMGKIGLIQGTILADTGAERLSFGQLWRASTPYFWRVFLLNILLGFVGLALGLILIIPFVLVTILTLGCGLLLLIPLMIVIGWFITVLIEQTVIAIVMENLGIFDALARAWNLIRSHLGPMALMTIILLFGSAILGFIFVLPLLAVAIPIILGIVSQSQTGLTTGFITAGSLFCIYLPILILLSSVLTAYVQTSWTLVFRRLTLPAPPLQPLEPAQS
jgi:hypothetical protein